MVTAVTVTILYAKKHNLFGISNKKVYFCRKDAAIINVCCEDIIRYGVSLLFAKE